MTELLHINEPTEPYYSDDEADSKISPWIVWGMAAFIGIPSIFLIGSMIASRLP